MTRAIMLVHPDCPLQRVLTFPADRAEIDRYDDYIIDTFIDLDSVLAAADQMAITEPFHTAAWMINELWRGAQVVGWVAATDDGNDQFRQWYRYRHGKEFNTAAFK